MSPDEDKATKPLGKLAELRQQVAEFEVLESGLEWAEETLRESEEKYRLLVDGASNPITVYASDGTLLLMNIAAAKELGGAPDDFVGKSICEVHPSIADIAMDRIRQVVDSGESREFETIMELPSGWRWYLSNFQPVRDASGSIKAVQIISYDITERKRAEDALREAEERYRALLNLGAEVGEAIVMLQDTEQGDAIQTFVSGDWPRMTGYSRKELLGMSLFDLVHPRDSEASQKRHKRKMSGATMSGLFEMSIIRKDGTEVPVELTSAYTTYKGERANVAFIRDISERRQAEERERELQEELNLSSRLASIGRLAAGVAHEINNPLTGILGFSQRLMRKSTDEEISRDLERIHNEAQRAARVVDNLLTFARRREPKKEYLDINEILVRTVELRAYELRTGNIELVVELAPGLPNVLVDYQQIQQVFLDIILNAEQAMTEANNRGKLSIKTQQAKGYIRISFADDGPGIEAEHLDRLFDLFFTTRGERGGTGLGLSVCHGIVTEHGGRIYAKSKPGQGATFFVELPLT